MAMTTDEIYKAAGIPVDGVQVIPSEGKPKKKKKDKSINLEAIGGISAMNVPKISISNGFFLTNWVKNGLYKGLLLFSGGLSVCGIASLLFYVNALATIYFVQHVWKLDTFLTTEWRIWIWPAALTLTQLACWEHIAGCKQRGEKVEGWVIGLLIFSLGLDAGTSSSGAYSFLAGQTIPFFAQIQLPKEGLILVAISGLVCLTLSYAPEKIIRKGMTLLSLGTYAIRLAVDI